LIVCLRSHGYPQASNHGDASVCYAPATNLDAPTNSLQNLKHRHAEQPAKKRATPCRIHVLPLLNRRGGKQLIFKNVCNMQDVRCNVAERIV